MTRFLSLLSLFVVLFSSTPLFPQNPQSDPQAVALAQKSLAALTNGVTVGDVTLSGNASWTAGSEKGNGTVTLKAKGLDESRIDLSVGSASRSEVRNDSSGPVTGQTVYPDGRIVPQVAHNTKTVAAWFTPAIVISDFLRSDAVISYLGTETSGGLTVEHIRMYRVVSGRGSPAAKALMMRESMMDLRIDSTTFLPVLLSLATHPDSDANTDIAMDIGFSGYKSIDGVMVPQRVTRFLQDSANLDITITGVTVNSGILDSDFTIQNNGGGL